MIVVQLRGGLGNQMFQYALARQLSESLKTPAALDLRGLYVRKPGATFRRFELDVFYLDTSVKILGAHRGAINPWCGRVLSRGVSRQLEKGQWNIVREAGLDFDPNVLRTPDNSWLKGYWASEQYFPDVRRQIVQEFTPRKELSASAARILTKIRSGPSIAVHVRRGDYVSNPTSLKFFGVKDERYYQRALECFDAMPRDTRCFVFSDDPMWCEHQLRLPVETIYVEAGHRGWEDLHLMSQCQHQIIANSTFSWWAAWLNQNPAKRVVAPLEWYDAATNLTGRDLVPTGWIRV